MKDHIKNELKFTTFGVRNYYNGIKDVVKYSLENRIHTGKFHFEITSILIF